MWLGEQITDRGIGNGMSLLIFAGIVAGLPRGVLDLTRRSRPTSGAHSPLSRYFCWWRA
jgi:preprotein translocase subunit SecY